MLIISKKQLFQHMLINAFLPLCSRDECVFFWSLFFFFRWQQEKKERKKLCFTSASVFFLRVCVNSSSPWTLICSDYLRCQPAWSIGSLLVRVKALKELKKCHLELFFYCFYWRWIVLLVLFLLEMLSLTRATENLNQDGRLTKREKQ